MTRAVVNLWGRQIGAVLWDEDRDVGVFEYTPEFSRSGIEVAPLTMPLRSGVYDFPALNYETFKGLPGMLADSLPDKFGNALINRWLAEQGRTADSFDPVERLCYTGRRGMGALEFEPATGERREQGRPVDIAPLVELANWVIAAREELPKPFASDATGWLSNISA
ncbi:HipA N-terminal domain-containing protein [Qipengyuania sp. XHP0211]|uniref:HipA N-terminal domain-containing protein n=1 Tax=Qipengyuania sp. XHP0211 TaxID=3038079 RepID=UPI00241FF981|nr:HipA N-terminal domain-containing protein [Qipengyuania sp. XHP0211]MDG5751503.1 HipA N-terminal domain-containing protein [Qipengyuania sp. XHP0211]